VVAKLRIYFSTNNKSEILIEDTKVHQVLKFLWTNSSPPCDSATNCVFGQHRVRKMGLIGLAAIIGQYPTFSPMRNLLVTPEILDTICSRAHYFPTRWRWQGIGIC